MLTGENGILTQASDAKVITEFSAVKEAVSLKNNEIETYKRTGEEENIVKVGMAYTNENLYGPINIWGYDTVFGEGWYKLDDEDLKSLGITNAEHEYVVNYDNGYVISTEKFEFNGEETYTTDEVEIKQLATASGSLYILRSDGTLWSVGSNQYGQLGIGNTDNKNTFQQIKLFNVRKIYSSIYCPFAITENNEIYTWGYNEYGQLGLSDTENKLVPTKLEVVDVKEIYPYWQHTILMKNDGTIWGTGLNVNGQLGLGNYKNRTEFTKIDIDNVKDVKLGNEHTIILKNDETVWTAGIGTHGELGLGDAIRVNKFTKTELTNVKQIVDARTETIVLKNDGTVWGSGYNENGELGIGETGQQNTFKKALIENVVELKCNYSTVIAKTMDGKIYGWGWNEYFQFGLDNNENLLIPQELPYENVKDIYTAGVENTFIIKKDGNLWGCGLNSHGQLAQGNFDSYEGMIRIDFIK